MGVAARKSQPVSSPRARARLTVRRPVRIWLKALRCHQWSKNLLLLMPAVLAHRINEPKVAVSTALGFVAFSLVASAIYLLNDLLDIEADRRHPDKKHRPFAAGHLSARQGWTAGVLCAGVGFAVATRLSGSFLTILALYAATNLGYNFLFKRMAVLDVVTLACLYALRVFAGGAATGVPVSNWLMLFSLFLFFSLALMKRVAELRLKESEQGDRDYLLADRTLLTTCGVTSGHLSALVLALYLNADHVTRLYPHPTYLWAAVVVHLSWLTRLWLLTHRGRMHSDPVVHALRDPQSYVALAVLTLIFFLAS